MVLEASDLPPGFAVEAQGTGVQTNQDVIHKFGRAIAPKLRRWGRLTGYAVTYQQSDPKSGALPGVFAFLGAVALYRTPAGAHASLQAPPLGCRGSGFEPITLAGHRPPGPDTVLCTQGTTINGARVRTFLVQWRRGRATGGTAVSEIEGATTPQAALTAAYTQDKRMRAVLP
jgi:hypothetical protein